MSTFLTMLTTQLRNQDPTQPLDPNQFTAQLSQFAAVEQQIAVNQNITSLVALQRSAVMLDATSLVGRTVDVASGAISLQGGATQALRLPAADGQTRIARVSVTNAAGLVRETMVPLGATPMTWLWDGLDTRGRMQAPGAYQVSIVGLDGTGTPRTPLEAVVTGVVSAVERQGDTPVFALGSLLTPVEALRRVQP
jgi:flagellar basal-body rod modification protein FlgD